MVTFKLIFLICISPYCPLSCERDKRTIGSFTSIVSYTTKVAPCAFQVEGEAEGAGVRDWEKIG